MSRLTNWLRRNRSSSRLGLILQAGTRLAATGMALVWTRVLLGLMGKELYGLFLSYQAVTALGGLGDLGLGGAVAVQTGRMLGKGDETELKKFLTAARAVFVGLAGLALVGFLVLSPVLPDWLGFKAVAGTGSLQVLFVVGAVAVAVLVLSSYVNNLNYAVCNVTWPVLPAFLLTQMALAAHVGLARLECPLWLQYLPYVVGSAIALALGGFFLKLSHPDLASILPLRMDRKLWLSLLEKSFWFYLYALGGFLYTNIGRLLINAKFGPDQVPAYQLNYRVCELSVGLIITALYVGMPKITQWLASPDAETRQRAVREIGRLNRFTVFGGCLAALAYLAFNDAFMRLWLGRDLQAPVLWQAVFAMTMLMTVCGQTMFEVTARTSDYGLRLAGTSVVLTAIINAILSFLAAEAGSILGIAAAAFLAQTCLTVVVSRYSCHKLNRPWLRLAVKSYLLPVAVIALAALIRLEIPMNSVLSVATILGAYLVLAVLMARVLGLDWPTLREEIAAFRSMLRM